MSTPRPRFTSEASRDLEKIVRWLGARDSAAATRWIDRIETACWRLAKNPQTGPLRPDLSARLRFFPLGNYLLFYRESSEGVEVIRVLHAARDYGSRDF